MNKGFKSLPEYVQRKIDPEMAKRYMGGGAVMDRPLFRQAGGPAQPNMQEMAAMGQQYLMQPEAPTGMPQQQVDPQQAAMVQGAEQNAMLQGEQIGAMVAQSTMDNIDAAEDPKSMIDALRGNAKPLEERYSELADYVGEEDANKTPESVLAMVQPTIMMTEEGAVDSGIGELMQQLVAGVDMSEGEAMGQGVGELMAMGAGNTPPANFNQGGPVMVRNFADGTPPAGPSAAPLSISPYYQEAQQIRREILGSPEERAAQLQEQKNLTQAQMLFDIAQAGLQFAGTTEGKSVAERLANAAAATQLFPTIGARAAQFQQVKDAQKQDQRAMDLSALESAERQLEAERARKGAIALEGVKLSGDLAKMAVQFDYTQQRDETKFGYSQRLAEQQSDLNTALKRIELDAAAARQANDIDAQTRLQNDRIALQRELNNVNNALKVEMQKTEIDAAALAREDNQTFQQSLQDQKDALQIQIQATANTNDKELLALRTKAQESLVKLQTIEDLKKFETQFGITSAHDLEKMEAGFEFDRELLDHKANIEMLAQNRTMAFTASQNALNRLAESKNIVTRAELTAELQKELQAMSQEVQGDENAKQRAAALAQNMINNAFTEDRIMIETARLGLDTQYKLGSLALEEAAANAVSLGSKSDTALLKYITDPARLNAYANGTLGDNKTQFEQTILNYIKPREVWDKELGAYVSGQAPELAPRIVEAIKKGDPSFYNQVVKGSAPASSETGDIVAVPAVDEAAAVITTPTEVDLTKIIPVIMQNGKVDLNSPVFKQAKTTLFKPDIDYPKAIGISRVPTAVGKTFAEFGEEIGVGQGSGPEGQNLSQANTDLQSLANKMLQTIVNESDDRVLKMVQEKIMLETEKLEPGGIFFKTDSDARASLSTLASQLALALEQEASKVPEAGGDASLFSEKQVQAARANMLRIVPMLNEVLAFQRAFAKTPTGALSRPLDESTTQSAVEFLEGLTVPPTNQGDQQ